MDVPMLGSLEPVFGFGVNALVRDHVIVTDQGQRAVVCVGNRLALVSALPHDGHSQRADAPPEPMVFLPNAKHVKQITAVCADEKRRSLAVCVEIDLFAEAAEKAAKAESMNANSSSTSSNNNMGAAGSSAAARRGNGGGGPYPVSPYQVIVYNFTQRDAYGAPKLVRSLTYDPAILDPPPKGSPLYREWDAYFGPSARSSSTGGSPSGAELRVSSGSSSHLEEPATPGGGSGGATASDVNAATAFDGPLRPFVSCCFSPDGSQVLAVSAAPEARAVCWHWSKNQVAFSNLGLLLDPRDAPTGEGGGGGAAAAAALGSNGLDSPEPLTPNGSSQPGSSSGRMSQTPQPANVGRIRFHPSDPTLVSTTGPSHVRLWRVSPTPTDDEEPDSAKHSSAGGKNSRRSNGNGGGADGSSSGGNNSKHAPRSAAAAAAALGLGPPKLCLLPLPPVRRLPARDEGERYSDHAWLADSRLVVCSDAGHLVVVADNSANTESGGGLLRFVLGFNDRGSRPARALCALPPDALRPEGFESGPLGVGLGGGFLCGGDDGVLACFSADPAAIMPAVGDDDDGGDGGRNRSGSRGKHSAPVAVSRRAPFKCVGRCVGHPLGAAVTSIALDPTAQKPAETMARKALAVQNAKAAVAAALPAANATDGASTALEVQQQDSMIEGGEGKGGSGGEANAQLETLMAEGPFAAGASMASRSGGGGNKSGNGGGSSSMVGSGAEGVELWRRSGAVIIAFKGGLGVMPVESIRETPEEEAAAEAAFEAKALAAAKRKERKTTDAGGAAAAVVSTTSSFDTSAIADSSNTSGGSGSNHDDGVEEGDDDDEEEEVKAGGGASFTTLTSGPGTAALRRKAPTTLRHKWAVPVSCFRLGGNGGGWHAHGALNGLSVCGGGAARSLVATCSGGSGSTSNNVNISSGGSSGASRSSTIISGGGLASEEINDASVRLWDYRQGCCVLRHNFAGGFGHTPLAVALHPLGTKLLVGFDDRVELYNLLNGNRLLLAHTEVTKGTFTLLGTGESLKPKEPPAGQGGGGGGSNAVSLVKSNAKGSGSLSNMSPPGSPSATSQNSDPFKNALTNGEEASSSTARAFVALGTVAETCVVTDKVSSMSFSQDGGRFVVVTGKVAQVFSLASPQHGGGVGRTQLLVGHAGEVATWSWDADERKVYSSGGADGTLYEWAPGSRATYGRVLSKVRECVRDDLVYTCVASSADGGLVASGWRNTALPQPRRSAIGAAAAPEAGDRAAGSSGGPAAAAVAAAPEAKEVPKGQTGENRLSGGPGGVTYSHGPPSSLSRAQGQQLPPPTSEAAPPQQQHTPSLGAGMRVLTASTRLRRKAAQRKIEEAEARLAEMGPEAAAREATLVKDKWANHHATLCVWPTADLENGRLELPLPSGLGCFNTLAVSNGGCGGRSGLPSVLLAGRLNGGLCALPWPLDSEGCSRALAAGEAASVGPTLPKPPPQGAKNRSGGLPPPPVAWCPTLAVPLAVAAHASKVTHMALSPAGDMLISASADGSLFVHTLVKRGGVSSSSSGGGGLPICTSALAADTRDKQPSFTVSDTDVVLAERAHLAGQRAKLIALKLSLRGAEEQVAFADREAEQKLKHQAKENAAVVAELKKAQRAEVTALQRQLAQEQHERRQEALENENSFGAAADELTVAYEAKMEAAAKREQALSERITHVQAEMEQRAEAAAAALAKQADEAAAALAAVKADAAKEQSVMQRYVEFVREKYDGVMDEEDARHDAQVAQIAAQQHAEYANVVKALSDAKAERAGFERKNHDLRSALATAQEDAHAHADDAARAREALAACERDLASRDRALEAERERSAAWETAAARQASDVQLLAKTKAVREHELHELRAELPQRDADAAASRMKVANLHQAMDDALQKDIAHARALREAQDKAAMLAKHLKASRATSATQARALASVAQQLQTLVDAQQDPQQSGGTLDIAAWLSALGRLHSFIAPLVATKLDEVPLDLATQQQEAQLKQLKVLEDRVALARHATQQAEAEGKRASARLRSENEQLLESTAGLKRDLHKKDAVEKQLQVEIAGLRAELLKVRGPSNRSSLWQDGSDDGSNPMMTAAASPAQTTAALLERLGNGTTSSATAMGPAAPMPTENLSPAESYRRQTTKSAHPLANAKHSLKPFRVGAAAALPPPDPQAAGSGRLVVPGPAPRDKQQRAVSSAMVPSNLARAATLRAVSTAMKHQEKTNTMQRVQQLEQRHAQTLAALKQQQSVVAALERGALQDLLGVEGARSAVLAALRAAAPPPMATPGGNESVGSMDDSASFGIGLGSLDGDDADRGNAIAVARQSLSAGPSGSGNSVHLPTLPPIG